MQIAAGLELRRRIERGEVGIGDLLEREELLRQRLVLLEKDLTGPAAGVGQLEQVEHARDAHCTAEDVVAERLDEIEHELRLAFLQAFDHLDDVVTNREDRGLVPRLFERCGDLLHDDVGFLVAGLEVSQDRDIHRSASELARVACSFELRGYVRTRGLQSISVSMRNGNALQSRADLAGARTMRPFERGSGQ